jgi:hypothetical protein
MPDEPLIFVEVASTKDIPGSVTKLLSEGRSPLEAEDAKTTVFYSISNCQKGLTLKTSARWLPAICFLQSAVTVCLLTPLRVFTWSTGHRYMTSMQTRTPQPTALPNPAVRW